MRDDPHTRSAATTTRQPGRTAAAPGPAPDLRLPESAAPFGDFLRSMRAAWAQHSPVVVETSTEVRRLLLTQYVEMCIRNGRLGLVSFALLLFGMAYGAPLAPRLVGMALFAAMVLWREILARRILLGLERQDPRSQVAHEVLMVLGVAVWAIPPFLLHGTIPSEQLVGVMYCALVVIAVVSVSYTSALPASVLMIVFGVAPQMLLLLWLGTPTTWVMAVGIGVCASSLLTRARVSHASLLRALTAEQHAAALVAELQTFRNALESENVALSSSLRDAHDDARRDPLTGLYNRRQLAGFDASFRRRAAASGEDISVCLGDIDAFKGINDRHGHLVGDEVLLAIARLLGQRLRSGDCLMRHGGEEFVIVLRRRDINRAFRVAESLRHDVASTDIDTRTGPLAVTISLGIAQWAVDEGIDDVIRRADRAMYAAKLAGRDRVEIDRDDVDRLTPARFESTRPAEFA